jgi:25S rRNA (uracil2843-N3)-methyltransferase
LLRGDSQSVLWPDGIISFDFVAAHNTAKNPRRSFGHANVAFPSSSIHLAQKGGMSISQPERRILALLRLALAEILRDANFQTTLQAVKGALYAKDYERAFGTDAYRSVYVARWVPSRALMFRSVFLKQVLPLLAAPLPRELSVVALGAGSTSELIALASLTELPLNELLLIDSADWSSSVSFVSKWLSKAEKDCGFDFKGAVTFKQFDCLSLEPLQAALDTLRPSTRWYTIFFTIHELFLQSRPATISMLATLCGSAQEGDLLIIVESASLSTIEINDKTYQLGLLLDHVLAKGQGWKLLLSEDRSVSIMPAYKRANFEQPVVSSAT